jgi:adenylate cyclase
MLAGNRGQSLGERLDSWKEIARYLGREVRTVQRWALSRGLPVHRLPGGDKPRVFSLKPEIDGWLQVSDQQDREKPASIAVLPFLNLVGSEEDQHFGDGLAEEVINALVRVPGLRVSARTSSFAFGNRGQDVRDIGAQLGTTWLLEGSVRRERKRVRVSAQLINTEDGFHAWSECYDRRLTDIFDIQEEIALSIATALKLRLGQSSFAVRHTEDLTAYGLWVKGRSLSYQYTPEAFAQARACYEAALARDPRFARPYFGLAELLFYGVQFGLAPQPDTLPRVRTAIIRSLELEDRSGDAHALLGICRGLLDYDWPAAEAAFQRAFALSPGSALVLIQHAWYYLVPRMRVAEALDEGRQAVELDPLSPIARGLLGLVYVVARQSANAVEECRRAVELAPSLWWLHWFYMTALLQHGKLIQGFREARIAHEQNHQPLVTGGMALIYGLCLRRKKAKQFYAELQRLSRTEYVPPAAFAFAYLGLGDDRVFEWLDKAIDARDPVVTHLPSMPLYDSIREDPRFRALLAKMHLG